MRGPLNRRHLKIPMRERERERGRGGPSRLHASSETSSNPLSNSDHPKILP